MKQIKTVDAVGMVLCHDITQIIPGVSKGPVFKKGHIVKEQDIPVLLSVGKENLFVWEKKEGILHEDEAAAMLAEVCAREHVRFSKPSEGKIEVTADCFGLLKVNRELLKQVNSLGEMMIATRHGNTLVHAGDKLAGTRIIPLVIEEEKMKQMQDICGEDKILTVLPFIAKKAVVVTTGSEVFHHRIEDAFTPVIVKKLEEYQCQVVAHEIVDDDPIRITETILKLKEAFEPDLILCTGGMSVDPDDRTPLAIKNTGAQIITYGAPVLPGAMFLMSYLHGIPLIGLPGCVMYAKRTIFDLVLPGIMAGDKIRKEQIDSLGEGGLCLNCPVCTYPNCGFGKN